MKGCLDSLSLVMERCARGESIKRGCLDVAISVSLKGILHQGGEGVGG